MTDFSYQGFDKETAVTISSDKIRAKLGEEITLRQRCSGRKQPKRSTGTLTASRKNPPEQTLVLDSLTEGVHKIVYKSETFVSNEITVEVFDNMISIESDKNSGYATDEFTFTAELSGDFESTSRCGTLTEKFGRANRNACSYGTFGRNSKVITRNESVSSNEIEIVVNSGKLTLTTAKNNYLTTETATITAETVGVLASDALT